MRRFCLLVAAVALLWAALVVVTGGFAFGLGGLRVSSRSPMNPLLLAVAGGVAAWAVSPRGRRAGTLADDVRTLGAPALAAALAIIIIVTGLTRGALVAGGSDAYGYVSQAEWWATGTFRFDEPLIREFEGLESWEVPVFQKRYAGHSPLAPLDWPPAALMRESQIRIYDPADRQALAGRPPLTEIVP